MKRINQKNIKISVIIPVYNAEKYIERCLNSVLNQSIIEMEIICIDDGSTDHSLSILRQYEKKYLNIMVLCQKNSYAGLARNFGLSHANGKYVHFLDADDYLYTDSYKYLCQMMEDEKIDFLKLRANTIDEADRTIRYDNSYYSLTNLPNHFFNRILTTEESIKLLTDYSPAPWTGIVRTEYLLKKKITFCNLQCSNDRSFYIDVITGMARCYISDIVLVCHQMRNKKSLSGKRTEHFDCAIQSYLIIENHTRNLIKELRKIILAKEFCDLTVWFIKLEDKYKLAAMAQLMQVVDKIDFNEMDRLIIENESTVKAIYEMGFVNKFSYKYKMKSLEDLYACIKNDQIIIYGAGTVAHSTVEYLKNQGYEKKIKCIMVTKKGENPDFIDGIPVYEYQQNEDLTKYIFILATYESAHDSIALYLRKQGIKKIKAITQNLFCIISEENHYKHDTELISNQYEEELKKWYKQRTGKELDLLNPITFNEKIQWLKLYGDISRMTELTDKWKVRYWIKDKIGEEYLVYSYGAWNSFSEIDFNNLPDKFVLKCNHGCTWNYIVKDKNQLNIEEAKQMFNIWMHKNYAYRGGLQLQYRDIQPLIIAEEYLENHDGDLYDYKFWCFEGKVVFIMFLSEREKHLKMNNYDLNWNLLPFVYDYSNSSQKIDKPENLDKMIDIAEKLATGFPHVRVDLYSLNDGTIKFGEMTFTSCSGACAWSDKQIDSYLGGLIRLPR